MEQQVDEGSSGHEEQSKITHRNPIDWESVEDAILGTRTFDADLYNSETFDERRPAYYRTGKTRDGRSRACQHSPSYVDKAPSTTAVVDFIEAVNTDPGAIPDSDMKVTEEVAIIPTEDELDTYKDEFDDGLRHYEPHFLRVPFFDERIVGNVGLSAVYGLAISPHAIDPFYEYEWNTDYNARKVTITITRIDDN